MAQTYISLSLAVLAYIMIRLEIISWHQEEFAMFNAEGHPLVRTRNGVIKGVNSTSYSGGTFYAFHAIPYAEPPLGSLRFDFPRPIHDWNYVKDGTIEGPACLQTQGEAVTGEEDCLWLSVYTPKLPKSLSETTELKPVLVWIHGGRYRQGTARSSFYSPAYLMDSGDFLVVSVQYRLGALGWLSTGDSEIPGNFGYHDQNLALHWVQRNIHAFGGDKGQVTIMGQSAGGGSVHAHMFSPLSRGLFHKVMAISGTATAAWNGRWTFHKDMAIKQAELVGCPSGSSREILECLRSVDARSLTASQVDMSEMFKRNLAELPISSFLPRLDPESPRPFMPENPLKLLKDGAYDTTIPFLTGVTSMEGAWYTSCLMNEDNMKLFNEQKYEALGLLLGPGLYSKESLDQIYRFYLGNQNLTIDHLQEMANFVNDFIFFHPVLHAVHLHSQTSTAPVYFYVFGYRGEWTFPHIYGDFRDHGGVSHVDDLRYIFRLPFAPNLTEEELEVMTTTTNYIRNFVLTGHPTIEEMEWPSYDKGQASTMQILARNSRGVTKQLPFSREALKLWQTLEECQDDYLKDFLPYN